MKTATMPGYLEVAEVIAAHKVATNGIAESV
jgi:hypothetical protein